MMKKILAGWVAAFLVSTAADSEGVTFKFGGGVMINPTGGGGHASIEIPLSEEYSTYAAPFVEYYSKDGTRIPIGASLLYKAPFGEFSGTIYFGIGFGAMIVDGLPPDPITGFDGSGTNAMGAAGGGISFALSDKAGVFVQSRYSRAFSGSGENEEDVWGVHVGIQFGILGDEVE